MYQYHKNGKTTKQKCGGRKPKKLTEVEINFIKHEVDENCSITLKELKKKINEKFHKDVSLKTISRYIDQFQYSIKSVTEICERGETPTNNEFRKYFSYHFLKYYFNNPNNIFFLDVTGFNISMRLYYGRSHKGKRAIVHKPFVKSRNLSVIATINEKKLYYYSILESPCNKQTFELFLNQLFTLFQQDEIKNAILVLDNATFHHSINIYNLIHNHGHELLFLPPYTPQFNPIEYFFAEWKNIVRHAAPKKEEELIQSINNIKNIITPEQCTNYIKHALQNVIRYINDEDFIQL